MLKYWVFVIFLAFVADARSAQLEVLSWAKFHASASGMEVEAELGEGGDFLFLHITTEFGRFSLSDEDKRVITQPNMMTLEPVLFPVNNKAGDVEYHLQFSYRGVDFSRRKSACLRIKGVHSDDYLRIKLRKDLPHELKVFAGICESASPLPF